MTAPDVHLSDAEENIHTGYFDNSLEPVLSIESGDVVAFECRDAPNGHFDADSTVADLEDKPDDGHPLTGPVRIAEAKPGDVLQIDLLDVQHKGWGVSYFYPGRVEKGLLPEDFEKPGLHYWELDDDIGHFVDDITVPLDPFPGIVGVAPAADGRHSSTPPRPVGGNLDCKHLTAGSTLYLPVEVDGALASIGDGHAAQGDGEVCVTGIETPTEITAQFHVRTDLELSAPQFTTEAPLSEPQSDFHATMGIADDLRQAAKRAIRQMIDHLESERGLSRSNAYILCSTAVDLKVTEVVNAPNWTVSAYLPETIFP
ncbi:MAG: acetamidase/formamidase family protein [Salinirussus sp.]